MNSRLVGGASAGTTARRRAWATMLAMSVVTLAGALDLAAPFAREVAEIDAEIARVAGEVDHAESRRRSNLAEIAAVGSLAAERERHHAVLARLAAERRTIEREIAGLLYDSLKVEPQRRLDALDRAVALYRDLKIERRMSLGQALDLYRAGQISPRDMDQQSRALLAHAVAVSRSRGDAAVGNRATQIDAVTYVVPDGVIRFGAEPIGSLDELDAMLGRASVMRAELERDNATLDAEIASGRERLALLRSERAALGRPPAPAPGPVDLFGSDNAATSPGFQTFDQAMAASTPPAPVEAPLDPKVLLGRWAMASGRAVVEFFVAASRGGDALLAARFVAESLEDYEPSDPADRLLFRHVARVAPPAGAGGATSADFVGEVWIKESRTRGTWVPVHLRLTAPDTLVMTPVATEDHMTFQRVP